MSTFSAKNNFFIILEALFSLSVDIFCMHILKNYVLVLIKMI